MNLLRGTPLSVHKHPRQRATGLMPNGKLHRMGQKGGNEGMKVARIASSCGS